MQVSDNVFKLRLRIYSMGKIRLAFFMIILLGCAGRKYSKTDNLNLAAIKVYEKIEYTENELRKFQKGKPADFNYINEIVQLSKIAPKNWTGDFFGSHYIPEENDIILWRKWFEENAMNFSFEDDKKIILANFYKKNKIIKIEYEKGKFRRSISESELKYMLNVAESIEVSKTHNH